MYIDPIMAVLVIIVAGLFGAAVAFIWTNARISRGSKVEHTILALAYAVSLVLFFSGMLNEDESAWALPVAVMIMGSGTAWANWRFGVKFWLVFGLTAFLGGASLLVMQVWLTALSFGYVILINVPWLALMIWLVGMILRRTWGEFMLRRKQV